MKKEQVDEEPVLLWPDTIQDKILAETHIHSLHEHSHHDKHGKHYYYYYVHFYDYDSDHCTQHVTD